MSTPANLVTSYLIEQGAVVRWEVPGERVQKSFLNITRPGMA